MDRHSPVERGKLDFPMTYGRGGGYMVVAEWLCPLINLCRCSLWFMIVMMLQILAWQYILQPWPVKELEERQSKLTSVFCKTVLDSHSRAAFYFIQRECNLRIHENMCRLYIDWCHNLLKIQTTLRRNLVLIILKISV